MVTCFIDYFFTNFINVTIFIFVGSKPQEEAERGEELKKHKKRPIRADKPFLLKREIAKCF